MSNNFYNPSGRPADGSACLSSEIRAEFAAIGSGFDKFPAMASKGNYLVRVYNGALQAIGCPSLSGNKNMLIGADSGATKFEAVAIGTWTPTLTSAVVSFTYLEQIGRYMRLGNRVFFWCQVTIATVSSSPSTVGISLSLPVTPRASSPGEDTIITTLVIDQANIAPQSPFVYIDGSTAILAPKNTRTDADDSNMAYCFKAGTRLYVSGHYEV